MMNKKESSFLLRGWKFAKKLGKGDNLGPVSDSDRLVLERR